MDIGNKVPIIFNVDLDTMQQNRRLKSQRLKDQLLERKQLSQESEIQGDETNYIFESNLALSAELKQDGLDNLSLNDQVKLATTLNDVALIELQQYSSKYITKDGLREIAKYFDKNSGVVISDIEELSTEMLSTTDESAEILLDNFLKNKNLPIAQIYVVLLYLFDSLTTKNRVKNLIKDLLSKLESQQSEGLFNFFSISNLPEIKSNISLASFLANQQSSKTDINSLKQIIYFVKQSLSNNYSGLVSSLMRYRLSLLIDLDLSNLSHQDKTKLGEFVAFEKNIQLVSSIYFILCDFAKEVNNNKTNELSVLQDYSILMIATLNFSEISMVNDTSLNLLLQYYTGNSIATKTPGVINLIISLFNKLPMAIYYNNQENKSRLISGLRNLIKLFIKNQASKAKQEARFDFINLRQNAVKYI